MGKGEAGDDIRRALRIQDEGIEWKEAERRKSRVFGICVGAKDLRAVCRRSWATREVKGMKWTLNSSNVDDGRVVGVKEKGGRDGGDDPVGLVCETPSAVCTRSRPAKTLHWAHNQICLVRCLRCPPRGPSLSRPRCAPTWRNSMAPSAVSLQAHSPAFVSGSARSGRCAMDLSFSSLWLRQSLTVHFWSHLFPP